MRAQGLPGRGSMIRSRADPMSCLSDEGLRSLWVSALAEGRKGRIFATMENALRLSQFMDQLRRVISLNFPQPFWLQAEIAQSRTSRGHLYLQLVEKGEDQAILAQSDAVLWQLRRTALEKQLGEESIRLLTEGNEVQVKVKVEQHAQYGLKLIIEDIDQRFSLGQMALRRKQIVESLRQGGLFDLNRRWPAPRTFQRLAIISSPQAAGWQDFHQQLKQNPWGFQFQLRLFPAAMQGGALETEVVAALEDIATNAAEFDAVVIIRGGGSRLDLAWFDNERVGETIARMPLPVITGIGHDIDETVCDLVAWKALKTPTAVAAWLLEYHLGFDSQLLDIARFLKERTEERCNQATGQLQQTQLTLALHIRRFYDQAAWRLEQHFQQLRQITTHQLERQSERLLLRETLVGQLDPAAVLQRGYSITLWNGQAVKNARDIPAGSRLETRLAEGTLTSITEAHEGE